MQGIGSIDKFNELLNRKKEQKKKGSESKPAVKPKRMVLTHSESGFPAYKEPHDDPLLTETVQQFAEGPLLMIETGPFSV